jgi:YVTN family beta-propeller protein
MKGERKIMNNGLRKNTTAVFAALLGWWGRRRVLGVIAVGGLLCWGMASAQAAPLAYITTSFNGPVFVIDTATNAVVATVPVATGCGIPSCGYGVAVHPAGTFVYVTGTNASSGRRAAPLA